LDSDASFLEKEEPPDERINPAAFMFSTTINVIYGPSLAFMFYSLVFGFVFASLINQINL
jgi:hypothetical protein